MSKKVVSRIVHGVRFSLASLALLQFSVLGPLVGSARAQEENHPQSPIKHVIVIVGENRSFDHIFATYKPKEGESVSNLLSKGISKEDGTPGPNYSLAAQYSAHVTRSTTFELSPTTKKTPYSTSPAPLNGGPTNVCADNGICTMGHATSSENGLDQNSFQFFITAATAFTRKAPDPPLPPLPTPTHLSTC